MGALSGGTSSGGTDEASPSLLVSFGPRALDRPSARRGVFSARPLGSVSPDSRPDDRSGRRDTPGPEGSGTVGDSRSAEGSSDSGGRSGSSDRSKRRASNTSEPLFGRYETGPFALVADVPPGMQWLVTALGALAALGLGASLLVTRRSGRDARRRRALLDDLGLLQSALLPPVPAHVGGLGASVAYRPWDGPGAGGDFYDVFPLAEGRTGAVLGDVAGHGREVIGRTSGLRHTLRAYLEAGLEPRAALELAGRVLQGDELAPLATAVLAVHDPGQGTLTWANAGHPPPILLAARADEPLTAVSAPPLGAGIATGLRQTTVPFPPGSTACLFTDGLSDARTDQGRLGRARLAELADGLGDRLTAQEMLDRVSREALEITDDMAVCVLQAANVGDSAVDRRGHGRVEELALPHGEVSPSTVQRFLWACGVEPGEALATMGSARELARSEGTGVLLRVETDRPSPVEISRLERASLAPVS
ncbi:MAG TPA: PP2C family protein-serine/threonine phosphatase [Thermoleophilaceae bacterium]|nr:PP2C family protein-serine/threonine phosphatase [Thermoleophilaceae bacterium]